MKLPVHLFLALLFGFLSFTAQSQLSEGGLPWSFKRNNLSMVFQEVSLLPPDITDKEDDSKENLPHAFSKLVKVDIDPMTQGTWEYLPDGSKMWRLHIKSFGAQAMAVYYSDFHLPAGVKLYLYNTAKEQLLGAFTKNNNRKSGLFATELIYGEEFIIELNVPENVGADSFFNINEISYAFRGISGDYGERGTQSDFCEVNINCSPEGDNWQNEKKGVVRIKIKINGFEYWCSGSLVNNTSFDLTPYILTADHCAYKFGNYATPDELETWIFYFNYEAEYCDGTMPIPDAFSMTGAVKIANGGEQGTEGSDFYLLRLMDDIPDISSVYFNGWSALDEASSDGVTIHHPDGDIKKISTYGQQLLTVGWQNNGLPSHWKVYWIETFNNWGVTEGGSSGSPLFDEEGRIIGTLTGGLATCVNPDTPDFYGKFSYHWYLNGDHDTLQLMPWLDPLDLGLTSLPGTTVGIPNNYSGVNNAFYLYPNPVTENLFLCPSKPIYSQIKIEILSVDSRTVFTSELESLEGDYEINITSSPAGIYLLRVTCNGNAFTKKLIKR